MGLPRRAEGLGCIFRLLCRGTSCVLGRSAIRRVFRGLGGLDSDATGLRESLGVRAVAPAVDDIVYWYAGELDPLHVSRLSVRPKFIPNRWRLQCPGP